MSFKGFCWRFYKDLFAANLRWSLTWHTYLLLTIILTKLFCWDKLKQEEWVLCRVFHKNSNGAARGDNTRGCSDETASALMDSYVNLDHHHILNQHVPCFSNLSQNQTNQSGLVSKNSNPLFSASSDQMVLRALLSQLTKNDKKWQSYGEGSSESQLTDIGIRSHTWNYWLWLRLTRDLSLYMYKNHIHDWKHLLTPPM